MLRSRWLEMPGQNLFADSMTRNQWSACYEAGYASTGDRLCQACGAMRNLEVHHKIFRSQTGEDTEQNLITLCFDCHAQAHLPTKDL